MKKKTIHSTDCCIAGDYATLLINAYTNKTQSITEQKALQAARQLEEILHDVWNDINYGEKTGFSKTQRWLDFVNTVIITNALLQDAAKELTEKINN